MWSQVGTPSSPRGRRSTRRGPPAIIISAVLLWDAPLTSSSASSSSSCIPLCRYDSARTDSCHVSRSYVGALVEAFQGGSWSEILTKQLECEALTNLTCPQATNCEVDTSESCAASRNWVISKLIAGSADGGFDWSEKCGVFGQLMVVGAECSEENSSDVCLNATVGPVGVGGCRWDAVREVCDASRLSVLTMLRQDHRSDLIEVHRRRLECSALTDEDECSGDCSWDGASCSLPVLESLLSVVGDDCPLRTMLTENAGCRSELEESNCTSRQLADGLPECLWREAQCEAHPMALEFELMATQSFDTSKIIEAARAAEVECMELSASACGDVCAPQILTPSGAYRSGTAIPLLALSAPLLALSMRRGD